MRLVSALLAARRRAMRLPHRAGSSLHGSSVAGGRGRPAGRRFQPDGGVHVRRPQQRRRGKRGRRAARVPAGPGPAGAGCRSRWGWRSAPRLCLANGHEGHRRGALPGRRVRPRRHAVAPARTCRTWPATRAGGSRPRASTCFAAWLCRRSSRPRLGAGRTARRRASNVVTGSSTSRARTSSYTWQMFLPRLSFMNDLHVQKLARRSRSYIQDGLGRFRLDRVPLSVSGFTW